MSYSAESTLPRQALDVGRCVNDAIEVYQRNWLLLVIAAIVIETLVLLSLLVLAGPLTGGVCLMLLRAFEREDKKVDFGDMFRCFDRFLPLLGLFCLTFIPIVVGLLLCVIPGLLLGTFWLYAFYLVVDKEMGVFDSLGSSKEIVTRKGFWLNLLVLVLSMALELAPAALSYVGFIAAWFISPIAWLIVTSAYVQQVREDRGELDDLFRPDPVTL